MKILLKISLSFFAFLLFTFAVIEPLNMAGNWYQQFFPFLNNRPISDITFTDSLTGYAVTGDGTVGDTNYIIKTTNGGDNWNIQFTIYKDFSRVKFLNNTTGYACGGYNASCPYMVKTTNGGINWTNVNVPCILYINDMAVLNQDTFWIVGSNSFDGGVYRTTSGGANWELQLSLGSQNPNKIYMYNARIGFIGKDNVYLRKTTNSGLNWNLISGAGGFSDMYFIDSLTGWKTSFQKTTNGGLNWTNQTLPQGGNIILSQIDRFSNLGSDTIWGVGGYMFFPGQGNRGMIFRTTNSGTNWQYQIPDTSINIGRYRFTKFTSKTNGWAYSSGPGVHTINGGDPVWLTPIQQISSEVPKEFLLYQNYPNPFNPKTNIKYNVKGQSSDVKLVVYDVTGKLKSILVDQKQSAGTYEVDFTGQFLSSGIYFYKLTVTNSKEVFSQTKKMLMVK